MLRSKRILEQDGFVWFRRALSEGQIGDLESELGFGHRPGYRPAATSSLLSKLGPDSPVGRLASSLLPNANPVRLVAFNKSPEANWSVPWHQDRVVAVRKRARVDGYSGWSRRDAVWHVEPPLPLLEGMIFARVHFDRSDERNGAMELAAGSHKEGRVSQDTASETAKRHRSVLCEAERGDIVFIKALTLHRSVSSESNANRRVLRIDFANEKLPNPLEWGF